MLNQEDIVFEDKLDFLKKPYFYTLQPHLPTQNKQLAIWSSLIYSHFVKNNFKEFSKTQLNDPDFYLTHNKEINRYIK